MSRPPAGRDAGSFLSHGDVSPVDETIPSHYDQVSPTSQASVARNFHPTAHPDSAYGQLNSQRFNADEMNPPPPPRHGSLQGQADPARNLGYSNSMRTNSTVTPGLDNLGAAAAGGGISGIALGVAGRNERASGVDAMRGIEDRGSYYGGPPERSYNTGGSDTPYVPAAPYSDAPAQMGPYSSDAMRTRDSFHSGSALGGAAAAAGHATPVQMTPSLTPSDRSQLSVGEPHPRYPSGMYDGPYQSYGAREDPVSINPNDIADDGDDGFMPVPQRRSMLGFGRKPSHEAVPVAAGAAAGAAAAGGVLGAIGNARAGEGPSYGPVPAAGAGDALMAEKNPYLPQLTAAEVAAKKRKRWLLTVLIAFGIVAVIVGAIVGGILGSRKANTPANAGSSSGGSSSDPGTNINTATSDLATNGDLDKNSPEIKKLMNDPNLHRVFYGMDYTPWGVQYPLCLQYPPSQNNVTRDMAILSQLTNTVRVYGTDCNQTQMVLHSIKQLGLTDMKLWLGVWIAIGNDTTNNRQIETLYNVIDSMNDTSILEGVIVGNEVLYQAGPSGVQSAETTLIQYLGSVRGNLTQKGLKIPVATSDLGDNWNSQLFQASDAVMANVHPFFGGVPVNGAASWTVDFFNQHDVSLIQGSKKPAYISETGWPSAGGNDCGTDAGCPNSTAGAVAGIDEMNTFMGDFVCQALTNGTKYFWFEAFDEPWKIIYDTPGKNWEDRWGLMDAARNLKPGVKIPDCGGKTVS